MKIIDSNGTFSDISLLKFIQLCRNEGYITYLKQNFPKFWNEFVADFDESDALDYSKTFKQTKIK